MGQALIYGCLIGPVRWAVWAAFDDLVVDGVQLVVDITYDIASASYYLVQFELAGGKLTDLYDFDYDTYAPAPQAAVVQASGLGNGADEQVFKYYIKFEGAFWTEYADPLQIII